MSRAKFFVVGALAVAMGLALLNPSEAQARRGRRGGCCGRGYGGYSYSGGCGCGGHASWGGGYGTYASWGGCNTCSGAATVAAPCCQPTGQTAFQNGQPASGGTVVRGQATGETTQPETPTPEQGIPETDQGTNPETDQGENPNPSPLPND